MTSTQPGGRPVDLDTLADYVEGLLDVDASADVADLIRDDPAWSSTYSELTAAQPRVTAALASAGTESMPADVVNRIDDALRSLQQPTTVVPLAAARARRSSSGLRSGWLKVAAVILLVIGLGVVVRVVQPTSSASHENSSAAGGSAAQRANADMFGRLTLTASGTDYTKATLAARPNPMTAPQPGSAASAATRGPAVAATGGVFSFGTDNMPAPLQRLADPTTLNICLTTVAEAVGGTPATVDFALYEHHPALIIGFSDLAYSVAVGATCGEPGAGAAILSRG